VTRGKRAALIAVATAPVFVALFAFGFMIRSELAFDERTCPFEEREVREVAAGVSVREEARVCQPEVEEHRWVLLRDGHPELPVAQRRLDQRFFRGASWTAAWEDERVTVEIHNPGQPDRVFHGPAPDAGAGS